MKNTLTPLLLQCVFVFTYSRNEHLNQMTVFLLFNFVHGSLYNNWCMVLVFNHHCDYSIINKISIIVRSIYYLLRIRGYFSEFLLCVIIIIICINIVYKHMGLLGIISRAILRGVILKKNLLELFFQLII